jgi:tetratricopeptide (TPR) repeat protein
MPEALHSLFEAWRVLRRGGDLYGEALVLEHVGGWYWAAGRPADGMKVVRRGVERLVEVGEQRALARLRLSLAEQHAAVGDFDEAVRLYDLVLRGADRERDRLVHAAATIGRGRVLVHRGRFDEAMTLLAQCLKELGRRPMRHPVYVDALNALALNFATFARGEKLVVGGLRYAGEAADRATDIGHLRGLVQALGIQVRGLLALGRAPEAESRMAELDTALASAIEADRRFERLRAEVELLRYRVCTARDDAAGADRARRAAWAELRTQVRCLEGTGYERGFLANVLPHREIVALMGKDAAN